MDELIFLSIKSYIHCKILFTRISILAFSFFSLRSRLSKLWRHDVYAPEIRPPAAQWRHLNPPANSDF